MEKEAEKAGRELGASIQGQRWEEMNLQQVASFLSDLEKEALDRQRRCRKVDSHDLLLQFLHHVAGPGGAGEGSAGDLSSSRQEREEDRRNKTCNGSEAEKPANRQPEEEIPMRERAREEQKERKLDGSHDDAIVWRAGWTRLLHASIVEASQDHTRPQTPSSSSSSAPPVDLPTSSSPLSATHYRLLADAGGMIASQHQQLCLSLLLFRDESWLRSSLEAIADSRLLLPEDLLSLLPPSSQTAPLSAGRGPGKAPPRAACTEPRVDNLSIPSDPSRLSQSEVRPTRRFPQTVHSPATTTPAPTTSPLSSSSPACPKKAERGAEEEVSCLLPPRRGSPLSSQSPRTSSLAGKKPEKSTSSASSEAASSRHLARRKKREKKEKKKDPRQKPSGLSASERSATDRRGLEEEEEGEQQSQDGGDDLGIRLEQNCFSLMDEYFLQNFGIQPDTSSSSSASSCSSSSIPPPNGLPSSSSSRPSSSAASAGGNKEKRFFRSLAHLYFLSSLCSSEFCVPIARHLCRDASFLKSLPSILLLSLKRGGFVAATAARALLHLAATGCGKAQKKHKKTKRSKPRRREDDAVKDGGQQREGEEVNLVGSSKREASADDSQPKNAQEEVVLAEKDVPTEKKEQRRLAEGAANEDSPLMKSKEEEKRPDKKAKKSSHRTETKSPCIQLSTQTGDWEENEDDDEASTGPSSRDDLVSEEKGNADSSRDLEGTQQSSSSSSSPRLATDGEGTGRNSKEKEEESVKREQHPELSHPLQGGKSRRRCSSSSSSWQAADALASGEETEEGSEEEDEEESGNLLSLYSDTIITLLHLCLKEQAIDPRGINALSFFFLAPALPLLLQTRKLRQKLFEGYHQQRHSHLVTWYLEVFLKALTDPQFRVLAANNLQLARYVSEVVLELASSHEGCQLLQSQKLRWFVMWRACKDLWKNDWNKGEHEAWELVLNKSIRGGKPVLHTEVARFSMWGTRASDGGCAYCMKSENTLRFLRLFTSPYAEDLSSASSSSPTSAGEKADVTPEEGDLRDREKKAFLEEILSHSPYRPETPPHTQRARKELERRRRVAAQKKREEEEQEHRRRLDEEEEEIRRRRRTQEEEEKKDGAKERQRKKRNADFLQRLQYIARVYTGREGLFSCQRLRRTEGKSEKACGGVRKEDKEKRGRTPEANGRGGKATGAQEDLDVEFHRKSSYICTMALTGYIFPWLLRAFEMHASSASKDHVNDEETSAALRDSETRTWRDGNKSVTSAERRKAKEEKEERQQEEQVVEAGLRADTQEEKPSEENQSSLGEEERKGVGGDGGCRVTSSGERVSEEKAEKQEGVEKHEGETEDNQQSRHPARGVAYQKDSRTGSDGSEEPQTSFRSKEQDCGVFKIIITEAPHPAEQGGTHSATKDSPGGEGEDVLGRQHGEDANEGLRKGEEGVSQRDATAAASPEREEEKENNRICLVQPTISTGAGSSPPLEMKSPVERNPKEMGSLSKSIDCGQKEGTTEEKEATVPGETEGNYLQASSPSAWQVERESLKENEGEHSERLGSLEGDREKQENSNNQETEDKKEKREEKRDRGALSLEDVITAERHIPLVPCPGCGLVEYCSEACRINDLPLHLFLCAAATRDM